MRDYIVSRLVKSEDLNHHGTLFAGRTAEWFVEASFIAAACTIKDPEKIVCLNIHGLTFKSPVSKGDIITLSSKIAYLGNSTIMVYTKIHSETRDIIPVEGYLTFVAVDENTKPIKHGLVLDEAKDQTEIKIREDALRIKAQK